MKDFDNRSNTNKEFEQYYNNSNYNTNNLNNSQTKNPNRVYINEYKSSAPIWYVVAFFSVFELLIISTFIEELILRTSIECLVPIIFLFVVSVMVLSATVTPLIKGILKRRCCKIRIKADVKDVHIKRDKNRTQVYTYQYVYMGTEYIITTTERSSIKLPETGDRADVLINENNPKDYYIGSKVIERELFLFGIAIVIFVTIWLKLGIDNYYK